MSTGLLVAFCAIVAIITFWPGPPDPDGQLALKDFLRQAYTHGLPTWITFGKIEFGANVVMFMPIGLFGALALARARWLIVPLALAASITIEVIQATRLADRVGSPRDVVANGLGALLGLLLAELVLLVVRGRTRDRSAGGTPTIASSPPPLMPQSMATLPMRSAPVPGGPAPAET